MPTVVREEPEQSNDSLDSEAHQKAHLDAAEQTIQ